MQQSPEFTRRRFIAGTAAFAATTALAQAPGTATPAAPPTIVFQGDSITDAGRDRVGHANEPASMGPGYVGLLAESLQRDHAGVQIFNRGVSGNRVLDLLGRWEQDTLRLQPDVVSILIGVNDTWHRYLPGGVGIKVPRFAVLYRMLLEDVREQRPACRLVLCEPFALPTPRGSFKAEWMPELRERMAVLRGLAQEFGAIFVPFQDKFEEAMRQFSPAELAGDGVHPSLLGHQLMARTWREATGL